MRNQVEIVLDKSSPPLCRYAGEELQRYIRLLFGFHAPIVFQTGGGPAIVIGSRIDGLPALSDQGYALRRQKLGGNDTVIVSGGSPRATLWAAYELVEQWGVHYLVQGDVLPDDAGQFRLPEVDIVREPILKRRGFRVINDMCNSGVFWSLDQHKDLFRQLAKLRFNAINISTYPHQPWAHWGFHGVERTQADLCYGFKHPIHDQTIGKELFGDVTNHTNPDFQGAETYEEKLAAGRRFMRGIIEAAHNQGLEVCFFHHLSDHPSEILRHLPEWSKDVKLPDSQLRQPHHSRLGLSYMGGRPEVEKYRTPLNPVFIDLVEEAFRAHIETYPNVEYYGLTQSEFPPGGAGVEECWRALDEKYGIEERYPFEELRSRAEQQFFFVPGRALTEFYGAIQTLRLYDILINERKVVETSSNAKAKVIGTFFSEHAQPLISRIFDPDRFEFAAIVDYLPANVADRMHTLEFVKDSPVTVTMITTIEDDNVGFLPQLVTPSLHKTVQKMREYGIAGYWFRQFDISPHEPSMAYMVESAWNASVTPESVYRRQIAGICGGDAVPEMLEAFKMVEDSMRDANSLIGLAFMMPNLYKKHWRAGAKPREELAEYAESLSPIIAKLESALRKAEQRGQRYAAKYRDFVRFAQQFCRMLLKVQEARQAYDEADEALQRKDPDAYGVKIDLSAALLKEALKMSEDALRIWAGQMVDATDLGTLAGLNAYGHDYLRGLAWKVYLDSQQYGFSL